jgi:hypothetical protein
VIDESGSLGSFLDVISPESRECPSDDLEETYIELNDELMNHCDAISDNMMAYQNLYYYLEGTFDGCEVSHISRANNEKADNLANIGSQCLPVPLGVFWEEIIERSIEGSKTSSSGELNQHATVGSEASKSGTESTSEPRGGHDDRRNLDATILSIHDEQNNTRRCDRST